MAQEIKLEAAGLYTNPSDLQRPEGALSVADNVVITRPGVIEPRRGVQLYATQTSDALWEYQSGLVSFNDATNVISYDSGSGTFTNNTGTYDLVSGYTAKAEQNFYMLSAKGPIKKDSLTATPFVAGTPKCYGAELLAADLHTVTSGINQMSLTSNIVTVNTSSDHHFYPGQVIRQLTATEAPYAQGNYTVLTTPTATQFTYALVAGNDVGNAIAKDFAPVQLETTNGWLSDGFHVAYRALFNRPDNNNAERPGAASPRFTVANVSGNTGWVTGTKANPVVRIFVPSDLNTACTVRLFRSRSVEVAIEPSDEMGLVAERLVSQIEINQGWLDIVDIAPDAMRGEALYVSPSQEGIEQNNERPPLAYDIAYDGFRMLYANTEGPQRLEVTLLSVTKLSAGNTFSIEWPGDQIEVFAQTYNDDLSFKIETGGSDAQNIRNTAINLCAAINRQAFANNYTIRAYYASIATDNPGRILIEDTVPGGVAFKVRSDLASMRDAFFPRLNTYPSSAITSLTRNASNVVTATVGSHEFIVGEKITMQDFAGPGTAFGAGPHVITGRTATTISYIETGTATTITPTGAPYYIQSETIDSDSDVADNRVYESKLENAEAVPLLNFTDVGEKNFPILRLAVMRNQVFAFKQDGLYIRTGPLAWELFDPTVKLISPRSVVTLQNQIYALTTMGVVGITDTGVEILSRPIENQLLALQRLNYTKLKELTFGVAYETERMYELRTITATGDTMATQGWLFNAMERIWTRDTLTAKWGFVRQSNDKRYLVNATQILEERKTGGSADYQDVSGNFILADAGVSADSAGFYVDPGWPDGTTVISNEGTIHIVSFTNFTGNYEVFFTEATVPLTATSFALLTAFTSTIQWAPITAGDAGIMKLWRDANVLFQNAHCQEMAASFTTELVSTPQTVTADLTTLANQYTANWDGIERPYNLSLLVPQETRRATRLNVKLEFTKPNNAWKINGLVLRLMTGGEKVSK